MFVYLAKPDLVVQACSICCFGGCKFDCKFIANLVTYRVGSESARADLTPFT